MSSLNPAATASNSTAANTAKLQYDAAVRFSALVDEPADLGARSLGDCDPVVAPQPQLVNLEATNQADSNTETGSGARIRTVNLAVNSLTGCVPAGPRSALPIPVRNANRLPRSPIVPARPYASPRIRYQFVISGGLSRKVLM